MRTASGSGDEEGRICGLLAVDIAGFSSSGRDDDIQHYLRAALYGMLECAFNRSDVPWLECAHDDRGDGALVAIPSAIPVTRVLGPLPNALGEMLRRHNRLSSGLARIRLRVVAHVGYVSRDSRGFVGNDVIHTCRLLDAPSLREHLAASREEMVFAVSDYVFHTIIRQNVTQADPESFLPLRINVKETNTRAWARVPANGSPTKISAIVAHQKTVPPPGLTAVAMTGGLESRRCARKGSLKVLVMDSCSGE